MNRDRSKVCPAHGWKVVAHHDKRGRLRCAEADYHKSEGVVTLRRCGKELVKKP